MFGHGENSFGLGDFILQSAWRAIVPASRTTAHILLRLAGTLALHALSFEQTPFIDYLTIKIEPLSRLVCQRLRISKPWPLRISCEDWKSLCASVTPGQTVLTSPTRLGVVVGRTQDE